MKTPVAVRAATTYAAIVGVVLTGLREREGLTQETLGAYVGVSQATWSKIERGTSGCSIEQLHRAATRLFCSAGAVLEIADRVREALVRKGMVVLPALTDLPTAQVSRAALIVLVKEITAAPAAPSKKKRPKGNR